MVEVQTILKNDHLEGVVRDLICDADVYKRQNHLLHFGVRDTLTVADLLEGLDEPPALVIEEWEG
ncbi:hypothetical protein [Alicyclobacillus shizuokensis]|uniref:hypothetical protein n=1 Tax=Alicyclobacillus shizuokensis TaxID=392014 RepID=UPI0008300F47|nr:hypothetical protein [Alicyclobacillus shizuokensis]